MRNPAFVALIDEIKALHESKNSDYARDTDPLSNLRRSEAFGVPAWKGVLVRLSDKWSRIEQLSTGKVPKHESLRDSLIDNAVYSLLAVLLLDEGVQEKPAFVNSERTAPNSNTFTGEPIPVGAAGYVMPDAGKMGPR